MITAGASIYHLKRRYGEAVVVFKLNSTTVDPKLGTRQADATGHIVRRAIITPTAGSRIAKAKAFNYDIGETSVLIDVRDIPAVVDFTTDDFVYRERGAQKLQVVTWEIEDGCWTITARVMRGDTVDLTAIAAVGESLGLAQAADDEVIP